MIPYLNRGQGNINMGPAAKSADSKSSDSKSKIIYSSEAVKRILAMVDKVAGADSAVLIAGKSGVGKELIAKKIHEKSYRKHKPFIVINCSCLSENIIESELFGHEKGAFTGADRQKIGLLEAANGGTLVLDEIGDLKPSTQTKILRFLQEGEIYRVGGKQVIQLDIRVICCTNKDLSQEALKGRFREDLLYRINTIAFTIPSLSERTEDIPVLLQHFLDKEVHLEKEALDILMKYSWPGNVRELKNLCERLRILNTGNVIKKEHLPENFSPSEQKSMVPYTPGVTLAELNKLYILSALERASSKREAAKALGITVKTLYNRLHEYGVFNKFAVHPPSQQMMADAEI